MKSVLLNSVGEWYEHQDLKNKEKNIDIINLFKFNFHKYLPKTGFFKSRLSTIFIFMFSIIPLYKIIKQSKPDYLVVQLITSLPLLLNFLFTLDTKIILRISRFPKMNIFRKFYWKIVSKKIYRVTCPTTTTYEYLKKINIFFLINLSTKN